MSYNEKVTKLIKLGYSQYNATRLIAACNQLGVSACRSFFPNDFELFSNRALDSILSN